MNDWPLVDEKTREQYQNPNAQVWEAKGRCLNDTLIKNAATELGLPLDGNTVKLFDAIKTAFE